MCWKQPPAVAQPPHVPPRCALSRSVGDSEAQQAQLSAVTKEATAKALLITIKKLQACCAALRCAVLCCAAWMLHLTEQEGACCWMRMHCHCRVLLPILSPSAPPMPGLPLCAGPEG